MVGNDYQRIMDGIEHWRNIEPIEAIYLFFDRKRDKYGFASRRNVKDLTTTLKNKVLKPKTIGYNPQSYQNVFCAFYSIIKREIDDYQRHALIDATSTTKEAYGAIVTLALMFKNIKIYIVPPQQRGWYVPSPDDPTFKQWFSMTRSIKGMTPQEIYLPAQRLKQPNRDERMVLLRLLEHGGSSDTLTQIMKWCNLNSDNPVVKTRFSRLTRRLERKGFIMKEPSKQGIAVSLTRFGRIYSEAIKKWKG
jgi:predicted transcriptional regulator